MAEEKEVKRAKKLSKEINGNILTINVLGQKTMTFDFAKLPADIQKKFGPFGLSHRLGDAAAGCVGVEAVASIEKVWEGLIKGDWTVRGPAQPKVSLAAVADNFSKLSDKDKKTAAALLKSLGINIPGAEKA